MITDEIRKAHDDLDQALIEIDGFSFALHSLALDWDGINNPSPEANAIMRLIDVICEKAKVALSHNEKVWLAARSAPEVAEVKP